MSQAPPLSIGPMPLTFGQILDRVFRLFRSNFVLFIRIASVLTGALFVIYGTVFGSLFLLGLFPHPGQPPDPFKMAAVLVPAIFLAGVGLMFAYAIFEGAETYAALQANLGVKVTFREAYRFALDNAGRIAWLMILRQLWIGLPAFAIYGLMAVMALVLFRTGGDPAPGLIFVAVPLMFLAYTGAIVYAVVMALRLALALPVCVAEGLTAAAALKRSTLLTRNAKGRIFLVLLVVYAAGYAVFMVFQFVCMALVLCGVLLGTALRVEFNGVLAAVGIGVVGLVLFAAIFLWIATLAASYAIAFAVLYHDQRLRIDGVAAEAPAVGPA